MKLKRLLKDIPGVTIKGSKEVEITGICSNSKLIVPGNLFVAKKGFSDDGAHYISQAVAAGAVAVVTDIYDPSIKDVVQIIHPNVASIEGDLAAQYYDYPAHNLFVVGITGTNGKTTSAYLIRHLLEALAVPCGLIGTVEYLIGSHRYAATRTTPDVISNHKMLREMALQGCLGAVMEVSSHALDQNRVQNIEFDVGVFTNLTLDHLDYHGTMERYCDSKAKLFTSLGKEPSPLKMFPKTAVVNVDDPWHERLLSQCKSRILTYGIEREADIRATNVSLAARGSRFDVTYKGQTVPFSWSLIGRFNVYNCLAAIGVGLSRDVPLEKIAEIIASFKTVSGRLERVPNGQGLNIFVDYAHTNDALENVLRCLNEVKKGKIITVFGCGGDRDRNKRPKMAEVAEKLSDVTIVTSDNPRSEDPQVICGEILQGFSSGANYKVELDRRKAIEQAVQLATPKDLILIAGKGHETYQVFSHKTIEFDDRKVASEVCATKTTKG